MAATKKNCPWCGIANQVDAQLCVGCGSALTEAVKNAPAPSAPVEKKSAKQKKQPLTIQVQPGVLAAGIVAVLVIGYFIFKSDAPVPVVAQNESLVQSDSSGQRLASMEKFLAVNPKDKQALLAYANMLHDGRQFPRAIVAYKKYLEVNPNDPDARVDMAICYFESGDGAGAIAELKKALEISPKHQPAMFNMGIVYLNQEKVKESNDWFSRCAAIDPTSSVGARAKQLLSQHSLTNKNLQ